MTRARTFDGTDDEIRLAVDASASDTFGDGTIVALVRRTTANVDTVLSCFTSGGTLCWYLYIRADGLLEMDCVGGGFATSASGTVATNTWTFVAAKKAAGSATPRFSVRPAYGAWTHANGGGAVSDPAAPGASGTFRIGFASGEMFGGDIAFVAYWDTVLTDAQIEAACVSYEALAAANPKAEWPLTQASTATAVVDVTANAHDETSITGTTATVTDAPIPDTDTEPAPVAAASAALTTNDPSVTFPTAYVPEENDVIKLFVSSTTVLDVVANASLPSGWLNPLGDGVNVDTDAHGIALLYHLVTSAEATAVTRTYTATNALAAAETGDVIGVAVRHVDPASVIDSINTTFDSANTPASTSLPSLTGTNLSTGSLVLRYVAQDSTGTWITPASHGHIISSSTNNNSWLGRLDALTTASSDVTAATIVPDAQDEYASITVALTKAPSSIPSGAATGSIAWSGAATGTNVRSGAGTGSIAWAGSATGTNVHSGAATGAVAWVGSADGVAPLVTQEGSASGSIAWVGSATGTNVHGGSATGAVTWAGSSTGAATHTGSASGAIAWAGSATGTEPAGGEATGAIAWVGSATGEAPAVGVSEGSATGAVAWSGSATGASTHNGAATGAAAWSGAATGTTVRSGAATGSVAWSGAATGESPAVGAQTGSASGAISWVGSATGMAVHYGAAAGAITWTGAAAAIAAYEGAALGSLTWAGSATGRSAPLGAPSVARTWTMNAMDRELAIVDDRNIPARPSDRLAEL